MIYFNHFKMLICTSTADFIGEFVVFFFLQAELRFLYYNNLVNIWRAVICGVDILKFGQLTNVTTSNNI